MNEYERARAEVIHDILIWLFLLVFAVMTVCVFHQIATESQVVHKELSK